MKIQYQSLWIDLPYQIVAVTGFGMSENLNEHTQVMVKAVIEDEQVEDSINRNVEHQMVRAGWADEAPESCFFKGYIVNTELYYEKGQAMLGVLAASFTQKWAVTKKSRSFQDQDATYSDIIAAVIGAYPGASWISCADTDRKIGGLVLQYEETDWEFLCRLASHFGTFLVVNAAEEGGRIYFGLPELDYGHEVKASNYDLSQDVAEYRRDAENTGDRWLMQENLSWKILSPEQWVMGEQVHWHQIACQVVAVQTRSAGSEINYVYSLARKHGIRAQKYGNHAIIGLSLPAVIKERSGNRIRVQFAIDPVYRPGNHPYFTYAIETVSWYCLPETGSLVHIYFLTWDEKSAIAIHAMRTTGGGPGTAGRGAVGDKSFTTPWGTEMTMAETGISFLSDAGGASTITLNQDGTLNLNSKVVAIAAAGTLNVGEPGAGCFEGGAMVAKSVAIESKSKQVGVGILKAYSLEAAPELMEDKAIGLLEDGNVLLRASGAVNYRGEQKDPPLVTYSDDAIKAEAAKQRESQNQEVVEVREAEADGKISIGTVCLIGGLLVVGVGLAAATVASFGAATPAWGPYVAAVGTSLGAIGAVEGGFSIAEGVQDKVKLRSGDFTQSSNLILEHGYGNNRELYNTLMVGKVMFGMSLVMAAAGPLIGSGKPSAFLSKQFFANLGKQAAVSSTLTISQVLVLDMADGYIDHDLAYYASLGAKTAAVTLAGGLVMGPAVNFIKGLGPMQEFFQTSAFAPLAVVGLETAGDVMMDAFGSYVLNQDFNLLVSITSHLTSNALFSIDPVDVVTGSMYQKETDMWLWEFGEATFLIQRFYNSGAFYYGVGGKGWRFSFDSRLIFREDKQYADIFCVDGHSESFILTEKGYQNKKGAGQAYELVQNNEKGYEFICHSQKKVYCYNHEGRLLIIRDRAGNEVKFHYQGGRLDKIVTFTGHEITVSYQGGYVSELKDDTGRTVQYKYENDCITHVCHVDQGITSYCYDGKGNLTRIVNPAGSAYITNEYDESGRVIAQHYPDGTKSTVAYAPEKRETTVCMEPFDRTEHYCYNEQNLVIRSTFDDGTAIEYGYDEWQNRVYEKGRMGNETRRGYDRRGNLLYEEESCGQRWDYEYDGSGNLLRKWSSGGAELRYAYDERGLLVRKEQKTAEGVWSSTAYEADRYGRTLRMTDGEGNETLYGYEDRNGLSPEPTLIVDALGQEVRYEYDKAGRRTAILTEYGRVEFGYNNRDLVTCIRDGEGNETRKSYDMAGNLTVLTPPNLKDSGTGWSYRYDHFNRLAEERSPVGTVKRTDCDLAGNVLREIHPQAYQVAGEAGAAIRYEYDFDRNRLRTIYPDGSVERSFYDANGKETKHVAPEDYDPARDDGPGMCYEYDPLGRLTAVRGPEGGLEKAYFYDRQGNMVREEDAAGHSTCHRYDLAGNLLETRTPVREQEGEAVYRVVRYRYDKNHNRTSEERGLDLVKEGESPGRWNRISYVYDKLNRLVTVRDEKSAQISYRYDCLNQKTCERMRINEDTWKVVHYEYDRAGRLVGKREEINHKFLAPDRKKGSAWAVTRYTYDGNGNCIRILTPKGYRKEFTYDAKDRLTGRTETDRESGIKRSYEYRYDAADNLTERIERSGGENRRRSYRYDYRNRLTHYTDEEGATTRLFYDRNGRIRKAVRPEQYDTESDDGSGTSYLYDHQDRLRRILGPDGNLQEEHIYDRAGNRTGLIRGGSLHQGISYDLAGNPVAVFRGSEKKRIQSYTYDAWGNISGLKDGNGNNTRLILDEWGRITGIHNPDGGEEAYTYDYAGNITSTTDANGRTVTYRYNSFGQVYEIIDQDGVSEYFYYDEEGRPETHIDRNGNRERTHYNMDNRLLYRRGEDKNGRNAVTHQYAYYPDGALKEAAGGGITYQYEYTKTGSLKRKLADGRPALAYGYDRNGNLTEVVSGETGTTAYSYDVCGRIKRVQAGRLTAAYSYTPAGQLENIVYGNGVATACRYLEDGRLGSLVSVSGDGKVLLDYDYAYDGNGNCIRKSGERYRNEYSYDPMNRLREASYDGKREWYSYDRAGNRLKKGSGEQEETYSYNRKNQLVRWEQGNDSVTYRYDRQGNVLEEKGRGQTRTYRYDSLNRQSSAEAGSFHQENRYDGENMRYETEEGRKATRFLYDQGELVREESGGQRQDYFYGNGVIGTQREGEQSYYIRDELGSILFLVDERRQIRKSYRYDAFGRLLKESGAMENRLLYAGQMYDGALGQYYLRARYYNPVIGRFTQEDVYRGDGLNLYAYCRNHPVKYCDPSGYMSFCPDYGMPNNVTPDDLNAFGNKSQPRNARATKDFGVTGDFDIVAGQAPPLPKGASTVLDVNEAPLSGHYHTLPGGTVLPDGLGVVADGNDILKNSPHGKGHHTIFPTRDMTVSKFNELYQSLPWSYGGKK